MTRRLATLALLLTACAPAWDAARLEARYPLLAAVGTARLAEATPYVLPREDRFVAFLCRWNTARPLRVAVMDAAPDEAALVDRALAAWQAAGLGLRFERSDDAADLRVLFSDHGLAHSGVTAADCLVEDAPTDDPELLPAHLAHASIWIRRVERDFRGKEVPLAADELLGVILHELGHAFGYQGHARRGHSVMVRNLQAVRRVGHAVLEGEPLRDDALVALYRVPSGAVVGGAALSHGTTEVLDRLGRVAEGRGLEGPAVRVGERGGLVSWRDPRTRARYGVHLDHPLEVLLDPTQLTLRPGPNALSLLEESAVAAP